MTTTPVTQDVYDRDLANLRAMKPGGFVTTAVGDYMMQSEMIRGEARWYWIMHARTGTAGWVTIPGSPESGRPGPCRTVAARHYREHTAVSPAAASGVRWSVTLTSFRGAVGATHYYADLSDGSDDIRVEHCMTAAEARALTKKDDYTWRPGSWTERFDTVDDAVAATIALWQFIADADRDILVMNDRYGFVDDAVHDSVLAGTNTGQDRRHRTVYGAGAPPSALPNSDDVVTMRLPDGAWVVAEPWPNLWIDSDIGPLVTPGRLDGLNTDMVDTRGM